MQWIRNYGIAFVLALILHAAALIFQFALVDGLKFESKEIILQPRVVRASLIILDAQESSPETVAPPSLSPIIPLPETESTPTAEEEKDILDDLDLSDESQKRLQTLEELRDSTLDDDISETIQSLTDLALDEESATYVNLINTAISDNWDRPPSARRGMEVTLQVELFPNGELNTVNIVESSGNDAFDRSAEKAVKDVKRFTVPENTELFEKNFRVFKLRFKPEDLLR
ncbi:MAG: cell envelope integrity protein TolA [Gammaproteobacteria bacterium]|nr:cell envelope integrity protein TolA [Gammaproteobacteria bacterium]